MSGQIARAIETGIASYGVAALFLSAEYAKQIWLLISFALALARIAAEQHELTEASSSTEESLDDPATEPQFAEFRS